MVKMLNNNRSLEQFMYVCGRLVLCLQAQASQGSALHLNYRHGLLEGHLGGCPGHLHICIAYSCLSSSPRGKVLYPCIRTISRKVKIINQITFESFRLSISNVATTTMQSPGYITNNSYKTKNKTRLSALKASSGSMDVFELLPSSIIEELNKK